MCDGARIGNPLIAWTSAGALNRPRVGVASRRRPGPTKPPGPGVIFGEKNDMSNLSDAKGLCLPYGRTGSQYETLFEPATSTLWGYFKPRGTACFSLGLLKDIRAHDNALAVNGGAVETEGERYPVRYYVCGSRIPGVFNL